MTIGISRSHRLGISGMRTRAKAYIANASLMMVCSENHLLILPNCQETTAVVSDILDIMNPMTKVGIPAANRVKQP